MNRELGLHMVGGFRPKALLALSEEENVPSAGRCGSDRLLCCLIEGIHTDLETCSTRSKRRDQVTIVRQRIKETLHTR